MKLLEQLKEICDNNDISNAYFTTFSFSPEFFEKYIASTICRIDPVDITTIYSYEQINDAIQEYEKDIKVFYDPTGLNTQEIKRTCVDFIPIFNKIPGFKHLKGVFHPKVCLLFSKTSNKAWIITGSNNLTYSAWGKNRESFFIDEVSQKNWRRLKSFFDKLLRIGANHKQLPDNISLKEKQYWEFVNTFFKDNHIMNTISNYENEMYVWSPYFEKDLLMLINKLNIKQLNIIPDTRIDGKIRITKDIIDKVPSNIQFHHFKNDDYSRLTHAKVWLTQEFCIIGSWNFSSAALEGINVEAGVIVQKNISTYFTDQIIEYTSPPVGLTEEEFEQEEAPKPSTYSTFCKVSADWKTREYQLTTYEEEDIEFVLPGGQRELLLKQEKCKNVDIMHPENLLNERKFSIYISKKSYTRPAFRGFITEKNQDFREPQSLISLNDIVEALITNNHKGTGKQKVYTGKDGEHDEGNEIDFFIDEDINYHSLFFLTETIKLNIKNSKKQNDLYKIARKGVFSVEKILNIASKYINHQHDKKTVLCWFMYTELNTIRKSLLDKIDINLTDLNISAEASITFDQFEKNYNKNTRNWNKWLKYEL